MRTFTILVCSTLSALVLTAISCAESLSLKEGNGIGAIFMKKQELQKNVGGMWVPHEPDVLLNNLKKYDIIWGARAISTYAGEANWQLFANKFPNKLTLYYTCGQTARLGHNRKKSGHVDYDYIDEYHPEWFLLSDLKNPSKSDARILDNRIRWVAAEKGGEYYNRFYLDIGNKEFQKWAAQQFLESVSGKVDNLNVPFDGLGMDNANLGIQCYSIITSKHPNWKYSGKFEAWNKDFCDYLKVVKDTLNAHGFILVVNNDLDRKYGINQQTWDRLYESVDGLITEQELRHGWGDTPYFADDQWLNAIKRHEETLKRGLFEWWMGSPPNQEGFLYTYCSWLLIKVPGKSFYSSTFGKDYHCHWYEEYELAIGKPISARYLQDKCWIRDYENAKIIVNPTKKAQKVIIGGNKLWLDWTTKTPVGELELPAQSGRILLATPYKTN